jgi:hypothetical protein
MLRSQLVHSLGPTPCNDATGTRRAARRANLLALKLMAWRDDVDMRDAEVLYAALADASKPELGKDDVLELVEPYLVEAFKIKAC